MNRRSFLTRSITTGAAFALGLHNVKADDAQPGPQILGTPTPNAHIDIYGNKTDTTELWNQAFKLINKRGYGHIRAYGEHLISNTLHLPNVSQLHISGFNCILRKQSPGKPFTIINGKSITPEPSRLMIENLHLVGDWDTVQSLSKKNSRGIALSNYNQVTLAGLHIEAMRNMSLTANNCDQVSVNNCTIERSARDCINLSGSNHVSVTGCVIRHSWDDAIAVHVPHKITDPAKKYGTIVTGNHIEDSKGIKILGGENIIIAHNNIMRPQLYGIYMGMDSSYQEGLVPHRNVIIQSNIISDMIRHEYINVKHDIHTGILFNDRGREIHAIQISNNIISKSKKSGRHVRYSDWGYGKIFRNDGWHDPELIEPHVGSGRGIRIYSTNANDENEIHISNNNISGISKKSLIKRHQG